MISKIRNRNVNPLRQGCATRGPRREIFVASGKNLEILAEY